MDRQKGIEQKQKILLGLVQAYEKLIALKKAQNSELVILQNGKIVTVKP